MSPQRKKYNDRLESQPIEGRLDVLSYRLSESAVRIVESKVGIGGLWDSVKGDVEDLITENINKNLNLKNELSFKILSKLLEISRQKGNM